MVCTHEEIVNQTLQQFLQLKIAEVTSKKFDNNGVMSFDYSDSKKYKSEEAARAVRKDIRTKIEPIIEKWANDTFGPAFTKGFLVESYGSGRIFLKFNFPKKLKDAYDIKRMYAEKNLAYEEMMALEKKAKQEAQKEWNQDLIDILSRRDEQAHKLFDSYGNEYNSIDSFMEALLEEENDMMIANNPNQIVIQPSYEDYIEHKKKMIKKLEKSISKLYNEKRVNNTPNINQRIARFNNIKDGLEKDIYDFSKSSDKLDILKQFFDKDFELINDLLLNPTLENIFLAKDLFEYIKNVSDNRISNINNLLFKPSPNTKLEEPVNDLIKELNSKINFQEKEIELAVDKVFLDLLEKNETNLSKLYPGKSLEEIKNTLLENLQDIGWLEATFFTQGEQIASGNNLLEQLIRVEYEKEVLRQSSHAQKQIQKIDALIPEVEKELDKLGRKKVSKLGSFYYSGYDYRFLYQKDEDGNYKSSLIGKYSYRWQKFISKLNSEHNKEIFLARQNKDWARVEKLLTDKFYDLADKAEFVNFSLLHDIFIDSKYDSFKRGTDIEANKYKEDLIAKIGKEEYDNIIETQRNHLDHYIDEVNLLTEYKMLQEGVSSYNDLSDSAKTSIEISTKRLNPLEFIDSYLAGKKGMIEFSIGTQMNEKPSFLKYNTYIPRIQTSLGLNTEFYDKDFSMIENNDTLLEFWKTMRQSVHLINENLIDSNLKLNANSLLLMKKKFAEETLTKDTKSILKDGLGRMLNVKQFIKNVISDKESVFNSQKEVVLPTEIKSFESEVNKEFSILKTEIANVIGQQAADNTKIVFDALELDQQKKISELLGFSNTQDFIDDMNKNIFKIYQLKVYSERKVMSQQTLDIPMMIKAFLELSAEHKARTNSQNEINIYREKSSNILNERNSMFSEADTQRKRELARQKFFYNKVVLNKNQKDHSGNLTKALVKIAKAPHFDSKLVGKIFFKNFTAEEKKLYDTTTKRLDAIESEMVGASPSVVKSLVEERNELEARLRILGKDYLFSALFDNAINKLSVQVGLGYNFLANIRNRIQGMTALLSRDGEFWAKGNIYPVNHFVGLNKLRFINPSYKEEWDKAVLFIKQLNLVQDMTNELQRAESKIKQKGRIFSPMYGTEIVEYYNQVPGILAMAMDIEITDKNGQKHPFFDGSSFIAYDNIDGNLQLKEEFRTPENIQHFEQMDSEDIINWKLNIKDMINSLHGDYSKTGVTQIKGSIYTRPFMIFKTWLPKYFHSRYRIEQKNIRTGEIETGYLVSTFLNKKTSVAGGLMLGVTGILGILSTSPAIIALPLFAGIAGAGIAKYHLYKKNSNGPIIDNTEPILIAQQVMYVMKMLRPDKLLEVPINSIVGKEFIKPVEFKPEHQLTLQEQKDVRLMMRNLQNTIIIMLVKLAIQAMLADNEDDEPKGEPGTLQRKRYEEQQKRREEMKSTHNFVENLVTGMLHETSLAVEPKSLISTMGSKNGLEGPLDKLLKSSVLLARYGYGEDEITRGERAGQSKLGNSLRKTFLPSLFRDLGHDTWRGGFENSMEKEWITNEMIDGIFDSDYKSDMKKAKKQREVEKLHFLEEYEERKGIDIDDLTDYQKERLEKRAKKVAKKRSPNPNRKKYDDEQNLKE